MKKSPPRTQTVKTKQRNDLITRFDEAIAHCANIAAVAALLQGSEAGARLSVIGEDVVGAGGRLMEQEVAKLYQTIESLKAALAKPARHD